MLLRVGSGMDNIELGKPWEMYVRSLGVKRWERMVVAKIEDDQVILRLRGLTELVRVERAAMQDSERFRPANW